MMTLSANTFALDGKKLKELRDKRPSPRSDGTMTQSDLADAVGISRSYVAEIERNRRHPREWVVERIAEALDVEQADLLR